MAEPLISRLGELAIKVETTKGTKNLPAVDGSESKLRVFDLTFTDDVRLFNRRTFAKTLSRYPHLVGQTLGQISGRIELRKSATTNTQDFWGPILRAAGLAFSSGVYTLTTDSSAHPTLTALAWIGSNGASGAIRVGLRGCAATVKLKGRVGEPMMMEFVLTGVQEPSDTDLQNQTDALNTITHETAIPGIFSAVSSLSWGANSDVQLSSFEVDFGTQVVERQDITKGSGVLHLAVVDRDVTVTIDPEVPLTSAENWRGKFVAGTEVALSLTHNQPATSSPSHGAATFAFSFPKCQIENITTADRNGIAAYGVTLKPNLSSEPGDDEFSLTITKSS